MKFLDKFLLKGVKKEMQNTLEKHIDKSKYLTQIKVECFIETINNIDINELSIYKLKKILLAKWLIKNFEILDYNAKFDDRVLIKSFSVKEDIKKRIEEVLILDFKSGAGDIKFKYKNNKIWLALNSYHNDIYFLNKDTNERKNLSSIEEFLSCENRLTKKELNELLIELEKALDSFNNVIEKEKEKRKISKQKDEEFKKRMKDVIKELE